jgi:hypothetical protein
MKNTRPLTNPYGNKLRVSKFIHVEVGCAGRCSSYAGRLARWRSLASRGGTHVAAEVDRSPTPSLFSRRKRGRRIRGVLDPPPTFLHRTPGGASKHKAECPRPGLVFQKHFVHHHVCVVSANVDYYIVITSTLGAQSLLPRT